MWCKADKSHHGAQFFWNSLKTPGILNFFLGPWKTPWKNMSLYSWKTPLILWKHFYQFYKQTKTCRSIWVIIFLVVFYVDSILDDVTVEEITCYHFVFAEREFAFGSWKDKFFVLVNSWKTVGTLLSPVNEDCESLTPLDRMLIYCKLVPISRLILYLPTPAEWNTCQLL